MKVDPYVEALKEGVCLSDADGTILYMNPAARELLGLKEGAEAGLRSCDILCGRLFADGAAEACAHGCALRVPGSAARAVVFEGAHGPRKTAVWSDGMMRLRERWARLRVRCERTTDGLWGLEPAERHYLLITDPSGEAR